jgi:hypothetical protein
MTSAFAGKTAISGIGRSRIKRRGMTPPMVLLAEAFKRALDDAGLCLRQCNVDGIAGIRAVKR